MTRATLLRGFESHVAEIGGIRTRYWVEGTVRRSSWFTVSPGPRTTSPSFALLARRHRVLIPDLPGHGGRGALPVVESLGDLAAHVVRVAEHEDMTPAAVLGYSMGGVVALRAAAERPTV